MSESKGTPYFRFKCPRTGCGITDSEPGRCPKHGVTLVDSWQNTAADAKEQADEEEV